MARFLNSCVYIQIHYDMRKEINPNEIFSDYERNGVIVICKDKLTEYEKANNQHIRKSDYVYRGSELILTFDRPAGQFGLSNGDVVVIDSCEVSIIKVRARKGKSGKYIIRRFIGYKSPCFSPNPIAGYSEVAYVGDSVDELGIDEVIKGISEWFENNRIGADKNI